VTGGDVHDGSVVGFSCEEGAAFRIAIARPAGGVTEFVFDGVSNYRVNFGDKPIIYAVFAWKIGRTPKFVPGAEDDHWRLLAWPATREDLTAFAAKLSRDNPDSCLMQNSCSYGGDAALICRDIHLIDRAESTWTTSQ
jgi:hypothetical protein